jgi:hypothetical protein
LKGVRLGTVPIQEQYYGRHILLSNSRKEWDMRISTSIVLATVSIAFSTAAFAAEPNTPHQPMMLSP